MNTKPLILIALLSAAGQAWAIPPSYTITDLGTLGGSQSWANGINASGQVVGESDTAGDTAQHGFRYANGVMTDLGTLSGTHSSSASGINASGQIVGVSYTAGDKQSLRAFRYTGNAMTVLGTLGGANSYAFGINDSGQIVGYATTKNLANHAFRYTSGVMTDLSTLGGTISSASGINASGQIVGDSSTTGNTAQHAFQYTNGVMSDLGTLGGTDSFAYGINASGQVVGESKTTGNSATHAFRYANGVMSDLGTLGGTNSGAYSINTSGQIVGYSDTANGAYHAYLYDGGQMVDLNSLLPAGSGWTLQEAKAVNDAGQIAGHGVINGQGHAFLMSPGGQNLGSAVGVFRNGQWFLDANGNGVWDGCGTEFCFTGFGQAGDMPASGNWDGGSKSYIGVLRSGTGEWFIDLNGNRKWDGCVADGCYAGFGQAGDLPVAGDWTRTGGAKIGVFRNGQWFLDGDGDGQWDGCQPQGSDLCLSFGQFGDLPVAGDWSGSGLAGVGVFRAGTWYLDYNGNGKWDGCEQDGGQDKCLYGSFGQAGDLPAAGDWNGDGKAKVGVFRNGTWFLDYNGNGQWDGCDIDRCYFGSFGQAGDLPVAGKW